MRGSLPKLLVTGGAGFIGSVFVKRALKDGYKISVVDKLTYAGDLTRLKEVKGKFKFYRVDICDKARIGKIFTNEKPGAVIHFAAESHVDRSILDSALFIETNIGGTDVLLNAAKKNRTGRFIHISTDEVYGDLENGAFHEGSPLKPSSPYAASKAAADLLVKSYVRTFNFPAIIVRPSNNYGPGQYPEKLIPLSILKIMQNRKIPVYAKGKNVREWLFAGDTADAILKVLNKGRTGEVYNLGSGHELENIQVVRALLKILGAREDLIQFVKDRPGHDIRYKLDSSKIKRETGWRPKVSFEQGLKMTVEWCLFNKKWLFGKWKNIAPLYKNR
ncbi:MAG: dTDP-glucose 4,6-dehydratase [Candidatus Omnitrophota bacterium]|jgi:dTDP-glucose 4,6-dehydratase